LFGRTGRQHVAQHGRAHHRPTFDGVDPRLEAEMRLPHFATPDDPVA
jgi:hypothetical protein